MTKLDHFMYAVASLDEGVHWARETFGVAPAPGGSHRGLGTRNALLSLGESYLELIAPDPAQRSAGTLGERLAGLAEGGLVTWAASGNLAAIAQQLSIDGVPCTGPRRTRRDSDAGVLEWDLLFPARGVFGGCMPFFIDWLACAHPAQTNPVAGVFDGLSLSVPEAAAFGALMETWNLPVDVSVGPPALRLTVRAHSGETVILSSTPETAALAFG